MQLADALVTCLRDWGVEFLFGVSGANIEHLHDAMHRLGGPRFRSVCAKSEVGAAFMADAHARVHRKLGVCCSTSGGGMMNLAVGVAESFAESVPVLAIIGQSPTHLDGQGAFQDSSGIGRTVNAERLWSAISKYQARITDPDQFWLSLHAAVAASLTGRPGPSVLLIPRDLWESEVGARPNWIPAQLIDYRRTPNVSKDKLAQLFSAMHSAKSPVLILGSGVQRCSDPGAVVKFARRMGIRVATTIASKGAFPNDDPLHVGMVGVAGEPSTHQFLRNDADLLIAVGADLSMMTSQPIRDSLNTKQLVVVNTDVSEVLRITRPFLFVEADEGVVFSHLTELCDQLDIVPRMPMATSISRYAPQLAPAVPPDCRIRPEKRWSKGDHLLQSQALEVLQRFLPTSGHVLFDAGNCAAAALHYLQLPANVSASVALGMGGMGYAIAGAIGAQMGSPSGSRTLVICGDGAFLMLGSEVHTAVHYQLPILFVVFNNGMHGMCVTRQQLFFDGRIESSRYPDFSIAQVVRGFGSSKRLWVGSAGTAEEMEELLNEYDYSADRPGVLELHLVQEELPPFTPFLPADAPTYLCYTSNNGTNRTVCNNLS